jgi:hypothetical protein
VFDVQFELDSGDDQIGRVLNGDFEWNRPKSAAAIRNGGGSGRFESLGNGSRMRRR